MSAALAGDLARFQPGEVLQFLGLTAAGGRLVLERAGERAEIAFEAGRPVAAWISGLAVRTGEVLVHRRIVEPAALERALAEQRAAPGERIGALLVRHGAATVGDVRDAVGEVIRRILYGVTSWRAGRFEFHAGEAPRLDDLGLALDLDRVILESLTQVDRARAPR